MPNTPLRAIGLGMDDITRQRNRVRNWILSGKVAKRDIAQMAGIRDTVLIRVRDEDWNPTARILAALVRAIDKYESDELKKKAREESKRLAA